MVAWTTTPWTLSANVALAVNPDFDYVKVNFVGFEDFVDAIGGITLDNPVAFDAAGRAGRIHYDQGEIWLDGYQALVYARERQVFGAGDLARGQNHLRVLTAMIERMKHVSTSVLLNYQEILASMEGSLETGLTSDELSDILKLGLRYLNDWDIKSYAVIGDSYMRVCASSGQMEYIILPRQLSVDFAIRLMNTILDDELVTDELLAEAPFT